MNDVEYQDGECPVWLEKWPTTTELETIFLSRIRMMGAAVCNRETNLRLSWTATALRAVVGTHVATWTLLPTGKWRRVCTCHAPDGNCWHSYAAHLMLKEVCLAEEWLLPGQTQEEVLGTPHFVKAKPASMTPRPAPPRPVQLTFALNRPSIFSTAPVEQRKARPVKLEVEVDFKSGTGLGGRRYVGVSFYFVMEGRRELCSLAKVKNAAFELLRSAAPTLQWSAEDQEFLKWVVPKLRPLDIKTLMMNTLHVMPEEFKLWVQKWEKTPGRLLERTTQKPLNASGFDTPVAFAVELFPRGKDILVNAVYTCGDGRRYHASEVRRLLTEDMTGFVVSDKFHAFHGPIAAEKVLSQFGHSGVYIPREEVAGKLPRILEGHLEVLAEGPLLKKSKGGEARIQLVAGVDENGAFYLKGTVNDAPLVLKEEGSTSQIRYQGGVYHLIINDDAPVRKLASLATQLQQNLPDARLNREGGFIRLPANSAGAQALAEFWQGVPEGVEKRSSRRTAGILQGHPANAEMQLVLQERGRFVEMKAVCEYGGSAVSRQELNRAFRENSPYVQTAGGEWIQIDAEKFAKVMSALSEEGMDGTPELMLRSEAKARVERLARERIDVEDRSVPFFRRLEAEVYPEAPALTPDFTGILRPYQKAGVRFLAERSRYGVGSILADDMGLGKTLQVLALLEAWKAGAGKAGKNFRALVVAPASVVDTWRVQAERFCHGLCLAVVRGTKPQRRRILERKDVDVFVTHYGLVRMDIAEMCHEEYDFVVLDEAQAIKNPEAQVTEAVRGLRAGCRIALTGTPLENRLMDLWSILDFLNHGLCGEAEVFESVYGSDAGRRELSRFLSVLMLRRSKALVAPELPQKTEELVTVEMPAEMETLYERELALAKQEQMAGGFVGLLAAITRLRRFCCDPSLVLDGGPFPSPKLEFLMERLEELNRGGHSVLVFSQFTTMLDIIRARLKASGIPSFTITGETPVARRGAIVDEFNASAEASVFLLSLKAAGTGLTLTKADYVFLYDPWWNPSAENQAIDRTHRIGQDKPVFAYRIIVQGTVEEKVMAILAQKRELFRSVIDGADASGSEGTPTLELLRSLL